MTTTAKQLQDKLIPIIGTANKKKLAWEMTKAIFPLMSVINSTKRIHNGLEIIFEDGSCLRLQENKITVVDKKDDE